MTKVKVIKAYYDLKLNKSLAVGAEVEMTDERATELSGTNNAIGVPLVEILAATTPTTEKVAKAKAKPRKKDD